MRHQIKIVKRAEIQTAKLGVSGAIDRINKRHERRPGIADMRQNWLETARANISARLQNERIAFFGNSQTT